MKSVFNVLLIIFIITSCTPKDKENIVPEPEFKSIDGDISTETLIPENYQQFTYFNNASKAYSSFIDSEFYSRLKDNYLFLDFKYSFSENRDMFFTRFNFDFNSIFNYIERDTAFGITDDGFFLIASMTFKSKVLTSILNIAAESKISESTHKGFKIYNIEKGSGAIFYTVINEYIIFGDSKQVLISSISAMMNGINISRDYTNTVNENELLYVKKIDNRNNPFDIFPVIKELEVTYNTSNESISYKGYPLNSEEEYISSEDPGSHETLKYFDKNLPIILYNSSYNFKSIIEGMLSYNRSTTTSKNIDKIDSVLNGVYFVVSDVSPLLKDESPALGFVLNINDTVNVAEEALELSSTLLGVEWQKGTSTDEITLYTADYSDFFLVVSKNNIAVFTQKDLTENYIYKIENPGMSLFDLHNESFKSDSNNYSFACFNPETINETMEPLIKRYLFSNINMDDYEYEKSFGDLLTYFSDIKPGYMDLTYNQEEKNFHGSIKHIP